MRTLATLAVLAVVGSHAVGKAPVPKDPPAPSIDGKYTLVSVSLPSDRAAPAGPGGIGGPAGGPGGWAVRPTTASLYMTGPAVITKTQITLEGSGATTAAALRMLNSQPMSMEYTLDATKSPVTIDVTSVNPRGKKSKPQLGLVEMVGDRLIVAVAKEGDERPKNTEEADNVTVYYFQRAPVPKTEFRIVAMTVGKEADAEKELNRLAGEGFELMTTTTPTAPDARSSATTVHFVLKRVTK